MACPQRNFYEYLEKGCTAGKRIQNKTDSEPWMTIETLDNIHLGDQHLLNIRKSGMHEV